MHELSLCGAIEGVVRKHAAGQTVHRICVRVGQLRQVVPDTLIYCWALVTTETTLADSVLEIEQVAAVVRCAECCTDQVVGEIANFACPACGSVDVTVIAGEEFLVTALDVETAR